MRKLFYAAFLFITSSVTLQAQSVAVKAPDTTHIHYMGRVMMQDSAAALSWSGTAVKMNFNSSQVKAWLQDQTGNNFYDVIVDGRIVNVVRPTTSKQLYTLATGLPEAEHQIQLFKRTEWIWGKTLFYGFELDKNATVLPAPKTKKHKIEFFGNSITCGYAVIDSSGKDRSDAPFEENYLSYAAITARHFDAEYYCTARSGIGVLASFFPLTMPEMYNRLDGNNPQSRWNFSKYTPDVVVINLFQNDSYLLTHPEHEQFKARFGNKAPTPNEIILAYQSFVQNLRNVYPKAQIICILGSMDATRPELPWRGYIKQAVANMHDSNVNTLFFPYKNTPGHPNAKEQQAMADLLIKYIDQHVKW